MVSICVVVMIQGLGFSVLGFRVLVFMVYRFIVCMVRLFVF